jgi:hypothetical protein
MKAVKLTWGPMECECEQCVCQTTISFRQESDSNWYTPSSPANPTKLNEYEILIDEGVYYQVRLTFEGPLCQKKSTYLTLFYPLQSCCPSGYTISPDSTYCYKIEDIDATPPSGSVQTLVAAKFHSYSTCGSYIYNTGWNINGTGTSSRIDISNPFWVNGDGSCADNNDTDGPLNRTGVWVSPALDNQDIGFGVCLNVPETKTYYVGIAADNYSVIKLDGNTILEQDPTALGTQYSQGPAATFKVWHIYPIVLQAGPHILELSAHNVGLAAGLGCEIYNATASELIAAESYTDLGAKLIFSSKDYIGEPVQFGTGDAGYTCPDGYLIAGCEDPIKCRRILTIPTIPC